jgi:Cdc6-like AAA superfamily ATPase
MVNAIGDITAAAGVVVPFLEFYVDDAPRHNLRAAFVAGFAHGLGREALLLRFVAPDAVPSASDFRDEVEVVRGLDDITTKVREFCTNTLIAAQSIKTPSVPKSTSALRRLTLGATAAENEFRTLEDYFVETSEYLRTERGEVGIVAGRKGSGKTAIFFMVRDSFRRQKNSAVADLKPESYQLSLFKNELSKILDAGALDHTIAGFWYFVVLTEILLAIKKEIEHQSHRKSDRLPESMEIEGELKKFGTSESGDFTARIHRLSAYVLDEIKGLKTTGQQLTPEKLTNIVYRGGIAEAKKLVIKHAAKMAHLVFLFDNIDKGWATDGVDELDVRLVRLLLEALEKVRRDLAVDRRDFIFVIFLRNDVFELMVSGTPDKGKASVVRIDWTDRVKLKQVIHARLQASLADRVANFNDLWARFFVPQVNGRDTFEYFVDHCLMRPRFLIALIEYAIANAINRRHERVDEEDCLDAVEQHSNSILNDFGYEIRDVSGASEKVLHSLVGLTRYVTKAEVIERFERAKIIDAKDSEKLFQYMLWYGVIGVVNQNNVECYIYDFEYNMNRLQAEVDTQKDEPLYAFNPALHVALKAKGPQSGP